MAKDTWYNGEGGGVVDVKDSEIGGVDGSGNWVLQGNGQDFMILEKKDGLGGLHLTGFGNISIALKNGSGSLKVDNSKVIQISVVDGPGDIHLLTDGYNKFVGKKNGSGNIYYTGNDPKITKMDGPGKVIKRSQT